MHTTKTKARTSRREDCDAKNKWRPMKVAHCANEGDGGPSTHAQAADGTTILKRSHANEADGTTIWERRLCWKSSSAEITNSPSNAVSDASCSSWTYRLGSKGGDGTNTGNYCWTVKH